MRCTVVADMFQSLSGVVRTAKSLMTMRIVLSLSRLILLPMAANPTAGPSEHNLSMCFVKE